MSFLDAIVFGLIQGLTEFLPVSSSGHLLLAGRILGYSPSIAFELTAHLGTLLAVIILYRKQLWNMIRHPLGLPMRHMLLTTVCTVLVVLAGKDFFFSLNDGRLLPFTFLLTAVLLFATPLLPKVKRFSAIGAAVVGVAQGLAAMPGLSRSGTTVCAASAMGHEDAASYSFIAAIPVIVGSSIVSLMGGGIASTEVLPALVCAVVAAVSGFAALLLISKLFRSGKTTGFAVYLVLLSVFLFLNDFWLHLI